jgi:hypothetical protein
MLVKKLFKLFCLLFVVLFGSDLRASTLLSFCQQAYQIDYLSFEKARFSEVDAIFELPDSPRIVINGAFYIFKIKGASVYVPQSVYKQFCEAVAGLSVDLDDFEESIVPANDHHITYLMSNKDHVSIFVRSNS